MIISKDSNNNWTPVATGNGTFVGTNAAFDSVKDDLPDNTVAYTTDDGESVTDEITNGDMRAVTSNAVYDNLIKTEQITLTALTGTITYSQVYRIGNVVQGEFALSFPNSVTADTTNLVSGLPKPAINSLKYEIGVIEATQVVCRTVINQQGQYIDWYNQTKPIAGQQVTYYVNYICKD